MPRRLERAYPVEGLASARRSYVDRLWIALVGGLVPSADDRTTIIGHDWHHRRAKVVGILQLTFASPGQGQRAARQRRVDMSGWVCHRARGPGLDRAARVIDQDFAAQ